MLGPAGRAPAHHHLGILQLRPRGRLDGASDHRGPPVAVPDHGLDLDNPGRDRVGSLRRRERLRPEEGQGGAPGTELGADDLGGSEDGGGHGDGVAGLDVETIGDDRHIQLGRQPPGNVPAGVGRGEEDQVGPVLCDEGGERVRGRPAEEELGERAVRAEVDGGGPVPAELGNGVSRLRTEADRLDGRRTQRASPGQELEGSARGPTLVQLGEDPDAPEGHLRSPAPRPGAARCGGRRPRRRSRPHRPVARPRRSPTPPSVRRPRRHPPPRDRARRSAAIHRLGLGTHDAPQRGIAWLVDPGGHADDAGEAGKDRLRPALGLAGHRQCRPVRDDAAGKGDRGDPEQLGERLGDDPRVAVGRTRWR